MENRRMSINNKQMPGPEEIQSLVYFDLKMENLQGLLSSIVESVNSHNEYLNQMSSKLESKVSYSELEELMTGLSSAISSPTSACKSSSLKDSMDFLGQKLSGLSSKIEEFEHKQHSIDRSVADLQTDSKAETEEIKKINQQIREQAEHNNQNEEKLTYSFDKKIHRLQALLDLLESNMEKANYEIESNNKDLFAKINTKIEENDRKYDGVLKDSLDKLGHKIRSEVIDENEKNYKKMLKEHFSILENDFTKDIFRVNSELKAHEKLIQDLSGLSPSIQLQLTEISNKIQNFEGIQSKMETQQKEIAENINYQRLDTLIQELTEKADKNELNKLRLEVNKIPKNIPKIPDMNDIYELHEKLQVKLVNLEQSKPGIDKDQVRQLISNHVNDFRQTVENIEQKLDDDREKYTSIAKKLFKLKMKMSTRTKNHAEDNKMSSLISTKPINTSACLSCGRQDNNPSQLNKSLGKLFDKSITDQKSVSIRLPARKNTIGTNSSEKLVQNIGRFRPKSAIKHLK